MATARIIIIRFCQSVSLRKIQTWGFPKLTKSLVLYGPCPDNYAETTALFLKRKEINKKPVAVLASVLCKTEGRGIKNKIEFAKWKKTDLVGRDLLFLNIQKTVGEFKRKRALPSLLQ